MENEHWRLITCNSCNSEVAGMPLSKRSQNRLNLRRFLLLCLILPLLSYLSTTQDLIQGKWSNPLTTQALVNVPYSGPANGTSWWGSYINYVASPFPERRDNHSWCVLESAPSTENDNNNNNVGLWFVKNYKAASSSGAGITARMAHTVGDRIQRQRGMPCLYQANHEFADSGGHTHGRDRRRSFLWSIVRHPASRVLSGFFYFRAGSQSGDTNIMRAYANSEKSSQVSLLDSWPEAWDRKLAPNDAAARMQHSIMKAYDFVAVQERMDESLVVMKLLFGLFDWDIIVLPAKQHGSYALNPRGICASIPNKTTSQSVDDYLSGDFERDNYDYLLHAAVNRSLDLTIESLGREFVEAEVEKHRKLKRKAEELCQGEAFFPCSANGTRQAEASKESCYHQDWGCGYSCLDRIRKKNAKS